jgi:Holliday junction resolvase RusA-like endonuclease
MLRGKSWLAAKSKKPVVVVRKRGSCGLDHPPRPEVERVEITLPMPPSTNGLFANKEGGGRMRSEPYEQWISDAGWTLQSQRPGRVVGRYDIEICIPRRETKARFDIGNREKAISDLLVNHHVIADDSLAESILLRWQPPGPSVTVIVTKAA